MTSYCPVPGPVPTSPANRDYKAGFTAAMMLKDLKLAQAAARATRAATPLGAGAAAVYEQFVEQRRRRRGFLRHHSLSARARWRSEHVSAPMASPAVTATLGVNGTLRTNARIVAFN